MIFNLLSSTGRALQLPVDGGPGALRGAAGLGGVPGVGARAQVLAAGGRAAPRARRQRRQAQGHPQRPHGNQGGRRVGLGECYPYPAHATYPSYFGPP